MIISVLELVKGRLEQFTSAVKNDKVEIEGTTETAVKFTNVLDRIGVAAINTGDLLSSMNPVLDTVKNKWDGMTASASAWVKRMDEFKQQFSSMVEGMIEDTIVAVAEGVGEMAAALITGTQGNWENFGKNILP